MSRGTPARRTGGIGTILLQVPTYQHPLASGGTQQQRQPELKAKIQELEAKIQELDLQATIQELEAKIQQEQRRHHQVRPSTNFQANIQNLTTRMPNFGPRWRI